MNYADQDKMFNKRKINITITDFILNNNYLELIISTVLREWKSNLYLICNKACTAVKPPKLT